MSELEELRKKRMAELQAAQHSSSSNQEQQQLASQVAHLESQVRPLFTKEALTRYGTIKTAFSEKAVQLLVVIAQLAQAGKITKVDDQTLKKLLEQLTPKKRETKINRI